MSGKSAGWESSLISELLRVTWVVCVRLASWPAGERETRERSIFHLINNHDANYSLTSLTEIILPLEEVQTKGWESCKVFTQVILRVNIHTRFPSPVWSKIVVQLQTPLQWVIPFQTVEIAWASLTHSLLLCINLWEGACTINPVYRWSATIYGIGDHYWFRVKLTCPNILFLKW